MTPCAKYFWTNGYRHSTGRLETITDTYFSWFARRYCCRMVSPLPPTVLSLAIRISFKAHDQSMTPNMIST